MYYFCTAINTSTSHPQSSSNFFGSKTILLPVGKNKPRTVRRSRKERIEKSLNQNRSRGKFRNWMLLLLGAGFTLVRTWEGEIVREINSLLVGFRPTLPSQTYTPWFIQFELIRIRVCLIAMSFYDHYCVEICSDTNRNLGAITAIFDALKLIYSIEWSYKTRRKQNRIPIFISFPGLTSFPKEIHKLGRRFERKNSRSRSTARAIYGLEPFRKLPQKAWSDDNITGKVLLFFALFRFKITQCFFSFLCHCPLPILFTTCGFCWTLVPPFVKTNI